MCSNCETPFVYKEYEETHEARSAWEAVVADLEAAVGEAEATTSAAISEREKAHLEVGWLGGWISQPTRQPVVPPALKL